MIDEGVLKSILEAHTTLIYNLIQREDRFKDIDKDKIEHVELFGDSLMEQIQERLIK